MARPNARGVGCPWCNVGVGKTKGGCKGTGHQHRSRSKERVLLLCPILVPPSPTPRTPPSVLGRGKGANSLARMPLCPTHWTPPSVLGRGMGAHTLPCVKLKTCSRQLQFMKKHRQARACNRMWQRRASPLMPCLIHLSCQCCHLMGLSWPAWFPATDVPLKERPREPHEDGPIYGAEHVRECIGSLLGCVQSAAKGSRTANVPSDFAGLSPCSLSFDGR